MKIIITIGDCNGIGMEVMLKALLQLDNDLLKHLDITICGNLNTLLSYSESIRFLVEYYNEKLIIHSRNFNFLQCKSESSIEFGKITQSAGKLAAEALEIAVDTVINNQYDALVTMPVSKFSLYEAGWKFPGHTEMLAARCGVANPLMLLCTKEIRIAPATIHIPIRNVADSLSIDGIFEQLSIFSQSLKNDFGINKPKIAVLGLNPHASENNSIGTEENEIISPAIKIAKDAGIDANGPFSADGFFAHNGFKDFDGILAMYHDQGLIPLKLLAHGTGVNFTAGLPIIRTSPDHGTAFDIAGKNMASPASALKAIEMAYTIYQNRKITGIIT